MADPGNLDSFSIKDKQIINDLVKKQTVNFIESCDKMCELFKIVTEENANFEENALSSLVQYKILTQVAGSLLSNMIKKGAKPKDVLKIMRSYGETVILIALEESGKKRPPEFIFPNKE